MAETRLRQAIQELENRGHCHATWQDRQGRVCIEGAIGAAYGDVDLLKQVWLEKLLNPSTRFEQDIKAVIDVIHDQFPERVVNDFQDNTHAVLFRFNDYRDRETLEPITTIEECKFVLEKAAINREAAID